MEVINNLVKFVSDHPYSSTLAVSYPLVIPNEYHMVFSQLLLALGTQIILFFVEKLTKKKPKEVETEKKDKEIDNVD